MKRRLLRSTRPESSFAYTRLFLSGVPLDQSRARRPLRMRFFDGGGHLIVTQRREYSRPKAVVVLAPIRSRCGGAVGCRSRGGLAVKCSYLARPARGAGEIPEALPVAKVPHGHDASSAARLHAIGQAKIDANGRASCRERVGQSV